MTSHSQRASFAPFHKAPAALTATTMVIGDIERWKAEGRLAPPLDGFQFVGLADLTPELMHQLAPEIILSPLIGDDFDAVDVAIKLLELSFKGQYRAIADNLEHPELICREVRAFAKGLDFDLMSMNGLPTTP